jgi:hypothetical protein
MIHFLRPTLKVRAVCGARWSLTFCARNYAPETVTCPKCRAKMLKESR